MNTKDSITDTKTEILVKLNWNWNTCLIEIEIETEIHCKTILETELKYIANNGIEIETEIYLISDTTLWSRHSQQSPLPLVSEALPNFSREN